MSDELSQPPPAKKKGLSWIIWLILAISIIILVFLLKSCGNKTNTETTNAAPTVLNENTNAVTTNRSARTEDEHGPVARWQFNGDGQDTTGNGHTAASMGGAIFDGRLDGIDDAFTVANSPQLNPADAITVSAWWDAVDFRGAGNNGLVDKGYTSHVAPHYQYHLGVTGTQYNANGGFFDFWVALDEKTVQAGSTPYTVGKRYHLVGTYDGSKVNLYLDGVVASSSLGRGTMKDYGQDLAIATFSNLHRVSTDFLAGTVDDVSIWDRALTATEVKTLFDTGPK